jgi:hypothetical protein
MSIDFIAPEPETVPFIEWDTFKAYFPWEQGEHMAMIGPTGAGKTTLALELLPLRQYIAVIATKPKDRTLERFGKEQDFKVLKQWRDRSPRRTPRRIIWPASQDIESDAKQRETIRHALNAMFVQGSWTVFCDELYYLSNMLKLDKQVKAYLTQGRSIGLSFVCATQRPAWVPLEIYDQSTHLFFWRENDERNLNRISGIAYHSSQQIRDIVSRLALHEVLYINTRTGEMYRTMSPKPGGEVKQR